jgi:transposase
VKVALENPEGVGMSDYEIARHVGVAETTVLNWRRKLEASTQIEQIATRTATRKGKSYQMKIRAWGRWEYTIVL